MRAAIVGRMTARMEKCNEEGRTMDGAEQEEHDSNDSVKVKDIDGHLKRLGGSRSAERAEGHADHAGRGLARQQSGSEARGGNFITVTPNRPQGYDFARYLLCLGKARGNIMQASQIAQSEFQDRPRVVESLKAAVTAGTTTDADWANTAGRIHDDGERIYRVFPPADDHRPADSVASRAVQYPGGIADAGLDGGLGG